MPQALLPLFPAENTSINGHVSFRKAGEQVYYFLGCDPVFLHAVGDQASFWWIASQLVEMGHCTQMEIVRAFGVSAISVKRYVKKYREKGMDAFFFGPKVQAQIPGPDRGGGGARGRPVA